MCSVFSLVLKPDLLPVEVQRQQCYLPETDNLGLFVACQGLP